MKKDKLYTYGKKGNIFWPGGELNSYGWMPEQMQPIASPVYKPLTVPTLSGYENFGSKNLGTFNIPTAAKAQPLNTSISKSVDDYYKSQQAAVKNGNSMAENLLGGLGAASAGIGNMIGAGIGNGYSTGASGTVNALATTIQAINTGNPVVDTIKNVVVGVGKGLYDRAFGTKKNTKNIALLQQNAANARSAGNDLANASTTSSLLNASDNMVGSTGLRGKSLVKAGWTGHAKRKAAKQQGEYANIEDSALAYQNHGLATGVDNLDKIQRGIVNSGAFGGPLDYLGNNNMGAIEYGFMSDYLTNKKKQAENKTTANLFAGMPVSMFGEGGSIEIKHPGRLTELKKRTGKTEAELWAENNPGVRKMITFARNARKWSKALGGKIERDGVIVPDNTRVDSPIILPIQAAPKFEFNQDYSTPNFGTVRYLGNDEFGQVIQKYLPERWEHRMTNKEKENFKKEYQEQLRKDKISNILRKKSFGGSLQEDTLFALGGDIQSNGADFTTGMSHINAGGSHEENPNQGVQVGVDQEGTPNLVEEGETIFNDYVYSNRITADEETKKKFHIGKKREITFADLSKKLEKEAAERPNDPISQAALQAQMADLADEQERQKQEMEAAKAQAAFESLTPEEKVGVMQYAQQQDQIAQEQAMQEQMMAQQYAQGQQPMGLEEAAMMQQQQQMPMQGQPILGAYGGLMNRFDLGGLAWIKKHHPEVKNPQQVAAALEKMMQSNRDSYYYGDVSMFGGASSPQWHFQQAWNAMMPATTGVGAAKRHIQKWIDAGLDRDIAFNLVLPESKADSVGGGKEGRDAFIAARNAAYKELVTDANKAQKTSVSKPVYGTSASGLHTKTVDGRTWYRGADAQYYADERQALATRNQATPKEEKKEEVAAPKQETAAVKPAEVKSNADNSRPKAQAAPKAASSGTPKVNSNTNNSINVGTYRQEGNQWNTYGLPGLQDYLNRAFVEYDTADEADKPKIAQNIADTLNGVQQSYWDNIVPTLGQERQQRNAGVGNHQRTYNTVTNNAGFKGIDPITGQIYDKTDEAIIMPEGHNTTDNLVNGWVDEYSGPKTWLRHLGASGDALDAIVAQLRERGVDYSPYKDWTIGDGNNARQLYRASLINSPATGGATPNNSAGNTPGRIFHAVDGVGDGEYLEGDPSTWNGVGAEVRRETLPNGDTVIYHAPLNGNTNNNSIGVVNTDSGYDVEPIHRNEKWRYAGLFGPAVGLGMQALGIGRPDTKALDGILEGYDRRGASYADYKPIGNYITYRPMDIWSEQNRLNASSRATDRAIMNSTSPSRMAGLLASGYNDQLASGQLYRQALEYNDALRKQVADFNRGTDMFNAQAYNQTSQFNASQRERDRQLRAQLGMQAAAHKADMDAAWYNGIYGNVAGLFKGIGDLGRENAQHNMIADMAATGIFGTIKNQPIANGYVRVVPKKNTTAKGGKVNRKKGKRGLTF